MLENKKITVADYIAQFFVEKGLAHVFGYQGSAIAKVIDSLVNTGKVDYVQNYHEQACAFAADAYARVSHKVGVALATSGPGATNLVTGIANAQLDSISTFFITGQDHKYRVVRDNGARLNGFQDLDIVSMVKPITKYATLLLDAHDIRYELEKCYHLAESGRPGAVLLDIPIDIQFQEINPIELRGFQPDCEAKYEYSKTEELLSLLQLSKRPLILAGGGVQIANVSSLLKDVSDQMNVPVVTTLNGVDAVEGSYSFAGLNGSIYANIMVKNADLIIALGTRFGQQQVGKDTNAYTSAKIVHVDIDPVEFERTLSSTLNIYAPLKPFLERLSEEMKSVSFPNFDGWVKQADNWADIYKDTSELNDKLVKPVLFTKKLMDALPDDTVITADVGQNQLWVAQAFSKKGAKRLLNSTGLGAMGYSLPAAIGARYSAPDCIVVATTGDGGLCMNMQELILIGQQQLDIKVVVYNNNTLGMMREGQKKYYDSRFNGVSEKHFASVDLEKLADTFDFDYMKVASNEGFDDILPLLKSSKPCIIDLKIDIESKLSNRYAENDIIEENIIHD